MSLTPLRRRTRPHHEEPAGLPAPGPFPAARPPRHAVVIFVVVLIVMAWLLNRGYSVGIAMETAAGAGVLAAGIASRLADTRADGN
jgi:hypothetical protein